MSISDLSIRRHVLAWMVMLALMFFGLLCFKRIGVSQLPSVDFPTVDVSLAWEGAAPEVMESDVVDVVEQALMSVEGVKELSASVRQGSASVKVELDLNRDIDDAVQEIQTKLTEVQRKLPDEMDPPSIRKMNPDASPILMIGVTSNRPKREFMEYVDRRLKDRFTSVPGVSEIALGGYVAPSLRIWVDRAKLDAHELTVSDIVAAIKKQHVEIPAGRIEADATEQSVRVMGEVPDPASFADIVIPSRGGKPIYATIRIKDVATVEDGLQDVRRLTRINGDPSIGMRIMKQPGSNEVEVAHAIKKRLAEVQKTLPADMQARVVFDKTRFTEESIKELTFTLWLSALVTSIVCWMFLGGWSATLNILLAIPTSILGTFIVIYFLGFTLNTFTVLGLSLAVGIVVDDSIMVLENIVRYREQGLGLKEAASRGANQIMGAALATTLAIIAIFIPIVFVSGIMGKFFYEFGVTISVAVGLSLLEALMLTPMRCSQFLRVGRTTALGRSIDAMFHGLARGYSVTLEKALRHPVLVVVFSVIFFLSSLFIGKVLKKEFVPAQDQSIFMCSMQTPSGTSLQVTDAKVKEVEAYVRARPDVKFAVAIVGGFGGDDVSSANMFVTLKNPVDRPRDPKTGRARSQTQIMNEFRDDLKEQVKGIRVRVQDLSLAGFSAQRGFPVEFSIRGPDWETLVRIEKELADKLEASGMLADVDSDYKPGAKEVRVVPDRVKAESYGVSMDTIGEAVNALIGGVAAGKYSSAGRRYDVRVRLLADQRKGLADIDGITVLNNRGERVALKSVVTVEEVAAARSITRRDRERAIAVFANVAPGKAQADAIAAAERIAKETMPAGYRAVLGGSAATFKESSGGIGMIFVLGIVAAYMVLGAQYNSFLHPFIVLLALPFSISGAFGALLLGQQTLNLYSMIGVVLLMGIVKKNSIMLVDFTNQCREEGMDVKTSLMTACPLRLRPILMTTLATIAAAIPPAMAVGPGAEVRIPMSVTVIGGVAVSTVFTLYVIPCVYRLAVRDKKHPPVSHE